MDKWQRRTLYYASLLFVVMLAYGVAYHFGMIFFEGERNSFLHSLQIVVETFTTTGFGSDAPWSTPEMNLLVILMDLTGVFLIFLALPVLLFPLLDDALSTSPPRRVDDVSDHVIICSFTQRSSTLIDELEQLAVPYIVVEPDRDEAGDLMADDVPVVHGDPETPEALDGAGIHDARALVADIGDEANASIALTADQALAGDSVQIVTFAEDPDVAEYHRYAGADYVFTPRKLIGQSLAGKVTTALASKVEDAIEIGDDFEIVELPVQSGSELVGSSIADSGIRERTGANVVGAWFHGEFVSPPSPDATIDERTVLLVAGREPELEALNELTKSEQRRLRSGPVIVCGYGEVGSTVRGALADDGIPCWVVDVQDKPDVDIVGDATDAGVLERAGIHEASTVILALSDDTLAIFATLVIRQLDTEVEVIARANETDSIRKLYGAGADYALALSTVSGRMLASTIIEGDVMSVTQQIEVLRTDVGELAGETLAEADISARTGCTVVAVDREGEMYTTVEPDFRLEVGDEVVVIGPDEGIAAFSTLVGGSERSD